MKPKLKEKVVDTWFPEWGIGTCVKVLKTRFHILFTDGELRVYDHPHANQFLVEK